MADTEHHYPPGWQVYDEFPEEGIDWRTIDRLIILMSLSVTLRLLRKRRPSIPDRIRFLIMKRMRSLISVYKNPSPRNRR